MSRATRRLKNEYAMLQKTNNNEPAAAAAAATCGWIARPLESNLLHAHFLLFGQVFYDTPYEGGVYHGVLKFPPSYPMKPPSVLMRTPSGRFQPDTRICFSLSDFHPELWNPMWSIRSILTGLVSFMNSEEITTGGLSAPARHRVALAKQSLTHCLEHDALAMELFRDVLIKMKQERATLGAASSWPPMRSSSSSLEQKSDDEPPPKADDEDDDSLIIRKKKKQSPPTTPLVQQEPGKNAAKNKKKREKEKRKRLAQKFLETLSVQVPKFLDDIVSALSRNGMDVSSYEADHVCWRTESLEEYTQLVNSLCSSATDDYCSLLIDSEIGGRSIATFRLKDGISVGSIINDNDRTTTIVDVVEISAPKEDNPHQTGLEHVEFVIATTSNNNTPSSSSVSSPVNDDIHQSTLQDFMSRHDGVKWHTEGLAKNVNPDVSVKVELEHGGVCSVKFHLVPLAKVIDYEKENGSVGVAAK